MECQLRTRTANTIVGQFRWLKSERRRKRTLNASTVWEVSLKRLRISLCTCVTVAGILATSIIIVWRRGRRPGRRFRLPIMSRCTILKKWSVRSAPKSFPNTSGTTTNCITSFPSICPNNISCLSRFRKGTMPTLLSLLGLKATLLSLEEDAAPISESPTLLFRGNMRQLPPDW